MVVVTGRSDGELQTRKLRGEMREIGELAAEAVEDVEEVVGRAEREITDVIETEDVRDRSRVMNAATRNLFREPVVIKGRLGHSPDRPHGGRRVLLSALALAGGRGLIGALLSRCLGSGTRSRA